MDDGSGKQKEEAEGINLHPTKISDSQKFSASARDLYTSTHPLFFGSNPNYWYTRVDS
jgi:hypothetical protein